MLIQDLMNWDGNSFVILGLIAVLYVVRKLLKGKLTKYDIYIQHAINDLVELVDNTMDKNDKEGKHTAVASAVKKALPKWVSVFITEKFIDDKIRKTVDNLRDVQKTIEIATVKTLDVTPNEVNSSQLKDIVASVKKDITITPICEPRFDDYKKSVFGIKIKKLF